VFIRTRLLSIPVVLLTLWFVAFAINAALPITDPDTPWHIATGMYILAHHHVPTTDPFSWSMRGKPWVTQEWLFEVMLAFMAKHFAFVGIWIFLVVTELMTVLVVFALVTRITQGNRILAALAACLSTALAWPFWIVRPQIFSYLLFATFLLLLQRFREGQRNAIFWTIPLMLFWANVHGSASIGIAMIFLELLVSFIPPNRFVWVEQVDGSARWKLVIALVSTIMVGLINPNGLHEFTYALLSNNQLMVNSIGEWHSPDFHGDYYKYGVLLFLALFFLIVFVRKQRYPLVSILYFVGSLVLMLIYQRFVPYMALTVAPLVGYALTSNVRWLRILEYPTRFLQAFYGLVAFIMLVYLGYQLPSLKGTVNYHMSASSFPMQAIAYLEKNPIRGNLLNAYDWGGYLIFRGFSPFIDGRTDIYLHNHVFSDYMAIQNLQWNGPSILASYPFQYVLLPPGYAMSSYLNSSPTWKVVYDDGMAEIWEKKSTAKSVSTVTTK
jgi:hypothetical protein